MNDRLIVKYLLCLAMSLSFGGCAVTDPTLYYSLGQVTAGSSTARSAESSVATSVPRGKVAGADPVSALVASKVQKKENGQCVHNFQ